MWQGVHKVKSMGTELYHGNIQLYTKWKDHYAPFVDTVEVDFVVSGAANTIGFNQAEDFGGLIGVGGYVAIIGQEATDGNNSGLYKISALAEDQFTVSTRYSVVNTADSEVDPEDYEMVVAANITDQAKDAKLYKAYRDPHYITQATAMEDETFELDLTRYQSNAVVYYLQAKKFEDAGDIERHEYYMKKFKKQLEKASGSRKYGAHVVQGHWNMWK